MTYVGGRHRCLRIEDRERYVARPMWRHRVVAHDDVMFTSYDFSRTLVTDRQHRLLETARQHRLATFGRRVHRADNEIAADQAVSTVHYLPARVVRTDDGETRAAS